MPSAYVFCSASSKFIVAPSIVVSFTPPKSRSSRGRTATGPSPRETSALGISSRRWFIDQRVAGNFDADPSLNRTILSGGGGNPCINPFACGSLCFASGKAGADVCAPAQLHCSSGHTNANSRPARAVSIRLIVLSPELRGKLEQIGRKWNGIRFDDWWANGSCPGPERNGEGSCPKSGGRHGPSLCAARCNALRLIRPCTTAVTVGRNGSRPKQTSAARD